jgi:hypothetical protein
MSNRAKFDPKRLSLEWLDWADVAENKNHDAHRIFLSHTGSIIEEDLISSEKGPF